MTPLEVVTVNNIGWDLKAPCADCPFVKTSPYHEGVAASIPACFESIQGHAFAHTCHKTDNRPTCDGPKTYQGERTQHCAGAILMLLKTGNGFDLQLPLLEAAERGDLDLKDMTARARAAANVFTVREFLRFYERELAAQLKTPKARAALRKKRR